MGFHDFATFPASFFKVYHNQYFSTEFGDSDSSRNTMYFFSQSCLAPLQEQIGSLLVETGPGFLDRPLADLTFGCDPVPQAPGDDGQAHGGDRGPCGNSCFDWLDGDRRHDGREFRQGIH